MREVRTDPLTGDLVAISTERLERPRHLAPGRILDDDPAICPFCPGHEAATPPSLAEVRGPGGWECRAFPNRFPALGIEGELDPRAVGPYDRLGGVGAHEVIVESADHRARFGDRPERDAAALRLARDRMRDLSGDTRFKALLWFRNHGPEAGASLGHPHAQILATPQVPPTLARAVRRSAEHFDLHQRELLHDIVTFEQADRARLLHEGPRYVAFVAWAPHTPFETWIVPRQPGDSFLAVDDAGLHELADVQARVLRAMDRVLAQPPHNAALYTAPRGPAPGFRWHLRLMPRLGSFAGFELGFGGAMHGTLPEEAAGLLREAWV